MTTGVSGILHGDYRRGEGRGDEGRGYEPGSGGPET